MSSAVDIQIVSLPNLAKIESYINASSYRETIEYSANFNTRLCIERRLRLPFFDPQTGVAQNHCSLYMHRRQRMPGFKQGQLYSYPAARWRKSRRQYLTRYLRPFGALRRDAIPQSAPVPPPVLTNHNIPATVLVTNDVDADLNSAILEESSSLGAVDTNSDSKDSQSLKDELPREWFYDDIDINDMDSLDEPKSPADDEYDYDPRYGSKKRKKRRPGRKPAATHSGDSPRKGRPVGSGGGGSGSSSAGASGTAGGIRSGRGRRKAIKTVDPPSPMAEPPSFETAAAAVDIHGISDDSASSDLRSYRKYL